MSRPAIHCTICGHYHGCIGGCVVAMSVAFDATPSKRHCLNARCDLCARWREQQARQA